MTRLPFLFASLALLAAWPARSEMAVYSFTWPGAGGYEMRGALAFDAALAQRRRVTETEVQCFFIDGYHEGERIGHWALGRLAPETSWTLTFDPVASEFVVYGAGAFMPQAWNMNGFGDDCGTEGFGFNIGNAAQDLCLDGKLLVASQIPPERPFPARPDPGARFPSDACAGDLLLSALR